MTEYSPIQAVADSETQVSCRLWLPFSWQADLPAPQPGDDLHQRNLQSLHYIEALENHGHKKSESPTETELEIQRLESKLNLALDLLGSLVNQSQERPSPANIELSVSAARWTREKPIKDEQRGRLALYLHPLLANPITLPGLCYGSEAATDFNVHCQFDPLPDDLADALLAFVFRGHRRAIAEKRLQSE